MNELTWGELKGCAEAAGATDETPLMICCLMPESYTQINESTRLRVALAQGRLEIVQLSPTIIQGGEFLKSVGLIPQPTDGHCRRPGTVGRNDACFGPGNCGCITLHSSCPQCERAYLDEIRSRIPEGEAPTL